MEPLITQRTPINHIRQESKFANQDLNDPIFQNYKCVSELNPELYKLARTSEQSDFSKIVNLKNPK